MSAKKLSEFTAELRKRNVARPSNYHVSILAPKALLSDVNDIPLVSMWCSGASTPQTSVMTNDMFIEAGVRRKYAYDQDWSDLTLTFYIDQDYKIKKFFDKWKHAVVPYNRNFNYSDDYVAESLFLTIINQDDKDTYKYEFSRIYPKTISPVELSYANGTTVSTFYVDFVFEDFFFTEIDGKSGAESFSSKPSQSMQAEQPAASNEEMNAILEQNDANNSSENNWGFEFF